MVSGYAVWRYVMVMIESQFICQAANAPAPGAPDLVVAKVDSSGVRAISPNAVRRWRKG